MKPRLVLCTTLATVIAVALVAVAAAKDDTITVTTYPCAMLGDKPTDVNAPPPDVDCRPIKTTYAARYKRFARDHESRPLAGAAAQGDISSPHGLYVKVDTSPRQRVHVSWSVACETFEPNVIDDPGQVETRSGSYNTSSSERHRIRMPKHSARCSVVAGSAVLRGSVTVSLIARLTGKKLKTRRV